MGNSLSVPLAGGCTATDIVMGKDGKRDERKARRARKAEKQMNRRLHEKDAGQCKQSKRRKHSTASSAVLEVSFLDYSVAVDDGPHRAVLLSELSTFDSRVQIDT